METRTLEIELEREGWKRFHVGEWRGFHNPLESETGPATWIEERVQAIEQAGGARGSRYRVDPAPSGEDWFIKQYHHGGVLAAEEDVRFETPGRFLAEALASVRARREEIPVPPPVAVAYRGRGQDQFEGVYVSRFLASDPLSRRLRGPDGDPVVERTGRTLARLHEAELDPVDFQLDNLLVDPGGDLVVTDFDPVRFGEVSSWTRGLRLNRFERSLKKYGFPGKLGGEFRRGYRRESGADVAFYRLLQKPGFALKNGLSDLRYWWTGRPVKSPDRDRFLVRTPNWLGDAVMSLPAVQWLSRAHPASPVDVACRSWLAPLYRRSPAVRRVWELPDEKTYRFPPEVEQQRYATLLVLPKSLRTGIQAWFSGIPRRVGFRSQGRGVLLTDRVPLRGRDRTVHHARLYMELLESFVDLPENLPDPELEEPAGETGLPPRFAEDGYLTVHPGSAYGPAKRWPTELLNEFLNLYLEGEGGGVVVVGVRRENDLAREAIQGLPEQRVENRVGDTSLEELMSVLARSRGVVANDSGVMHLAAALGVPTVGIFGSTDPELTAPIGPRTRVVYRGVSCSPCFERSCPLDEDRYRCLTEISPESVLEHLEDLLVPRSARL